MSGVLPDQGTLPFIGRVRELDELRVAFRTEPDSPVRFYMIAGEPGIGKTRLTAEIAHEARSQGFEIVWGRCWEAGGAPAYWPWRQIVRGCLEMERDWASGPELPSSAHDLVNFAPEIRSHLKSKEIAVPMPSDPEQARFRLFDSMTSFLVFLSRPLLVIIDDLHAADIPSLLLLQFTVRNFRKGNLMLVATYRDAELQRSAEHTELIGQLASDSRRISLSGLSESEVGLLVGSNLRQPTDLKTIREIHLATGGNPLFVNEVSRWNAIASPERDPTAPFVIPNGIQAAIRRHVEPISPGARRVLAIASVAGRDFDAAILQRVSGMESSRLTEAINEAERAGLILRRPETIAKYRFFHMLVRDALYAEAPADSISRLHLQFGEALEESHTSEPGINLSELAYHFLAAIGVGGAEKAIKYARMAAQNAVTMLAFEEAEKFYHLAIDAFDYLKRPDEPQYSEVLCELGELQDRAGKISACRNTFKTAAELADKSNQPILLGRAALGFALPLTDAHADDPAGIALLNRALVALGGDQDDGLKAKLLSLLAAKLYLLESAERRSELVAEAIALARRSGDHHSLLFVLNEKRRALWEPENVEERLHTSTEALQLARVIGDPEAVVRARRLKIIDLSEIGDLPAAASEIAKFAAEAVKLGQPYHQWEAATLKASEALLHGNYGDAEALANEALALGQGLGSPDQLYTFSGQIALIYRDKLRLAEIESAFSSFAEQNPGVSLFACTNAYIWMELGRIAEARKEFQYLTGGDLRSLQRRGMDWLFVLTVLGELCCFFDDRDKASLIYDQLKPFAGRNVTLFHIVNFGSVSTYLANLATTMKRYDEAAQHFEDALRFNERVGALPWIAETQYEYARMLFSRGADVDRNLAVVLLNDSRKLSQQIGNLRLLSKIEGLEFEAAAAEPLAIVPASTVSGDIATKSPPVGGKLDSYDVIERALAGNDPAPAGETFYREGEYWTVSFAGQMARIKHMKGFAYIEILLRYAGKEIHAFNLVASGSPEDQEASSIGVPSMLLTTAGESQLNVGYGLGNAGEMLDENAKRAYRQRLVELGEELVTAKNRGDVERAQEFENEIDSINDELRRAIGLRGRDRVAGSASERARLNVTRSIKTAISRIAEYHPAFANHLTLTIRTGTFCCYRPDRIDHLPPTGGSN